MNTKHYIQNSLKEINEKIKKMESKTYTIKDSNMVVNDRVEYDRLIGEKRSLEVLLQFSEDME